MARKKGLSWSDIANTSIGKINKHKVADLWSDKPKPKPKQSKFNNIKVVIDGIKFDSLGEGRRYEQLRRFERNGLIRNLRLQEVYILTPTMKKEDGTTIKRKTYKADFVYFNVIKGCEVVEDFKGRKTQVYKDKAKDMKHKHSIEIYETGVKHIKENIL